MIRDSLARALAFGDLTPGGGLVSSLCLALAAILLIIAWRKRAGGRRELALWGSLGGAALVLLLYRQFAFGREYAPGPNRISRVRIDGYKQKPNDSLTLRVRPGGTDLTVDNVSASNLLQKAIHVSCTSQLSGYDPKRWPTYGSVLLQDITISNVNIEKAGHHADGIFVEGSTNPSVQPDIIIRNVQIGHTGPGIMPMIFSGGAAGRIVLDRITMGPDCEHPIKLGSIHCPHVLIMNSPGIRVSVEPGPGMIDRVEVINCRGHKVSGVNARIDTLRAETPAKVDLDDSAPIPYQDKNEDNRPYIAGPQWSTLALILMGLIIGGIKAGMLYSRQWREHFWLGSAVAGIAVIFAIHAAGVDFLEKKLNKPMLVITRWDLLEILSAIAAIMLVALTMRRRPRSQYQAFERTVRVR